MNCPVKKTILVNVNNKGIDWIRRLESIYTVKYSDSMAAHIFFSFCSLAINVITNEILFAEKNNVIVRVVESQRSIRNSLTICAGLSRAAFEEIQSQIPFGSMRIVHCHPNEIISLILRYVELTSDTAKAKLQADFFEDSKANLSKNETAKSISNNWLCNYLSIDENESRLLMEGFPSIRQLLETSRRSLEETSPVDITTINKLIGFIDPITNDNGVLNAISERAVTPLDFSSLRLANGGASLRDELIKNQSKSEQISRGSFKAEIQNTSIGKNENFFDT